MYLYARQIIISRCLSVLYETCHIINFKHFINGNSLSNLLQFASNVINITMCNTCMSCYDCQRTEIMPLRVFLTNVRSNMLRGRAKSSESRAALGV